MTGLIAWTERKTPGRKPVEVRTVCGLRFAQVEVVHGRWTAGRLVRLRCRHAARLLRQAGVTRAVFPEWSDEYMDCFLRSGVRPVEALPMFRSLAAELTRYEVERRHLLSPGIAVTGDRVTKDLQRCVTALCLRYRYVQLSVSSGGEELARKLRQSLGVPLVTAAARRQLETAEVLLLFSESPGLSRQNPVVLPLYSEETLPVFPHSLLPALEIPDGCRRSQFLAALWEAGKLHLAGRT